MRSKTQYFFTATDYFIDSELNLYMYGTFPLIHLISVAIANLEAIYSNILNANRFVHRLMIAQATSGTPLHSNHQNIWIYKWYKNTCVYLL